MDLEQEQLGIITPIVKVKDRTTMDKIQTKRIQNLIFISSTSGRCIDRIIRMYNKLKYESLLINRKV